MLNEVTAIKIACDIFNGTSWKPDSEEVIILARNLIEFENEGLTNLTKRLIQGGRKIWDTFAEQSLAIELINKCHSKMNIMYEPDFLCGISYRQPIDFVIVDKRIKYWIEVKRSSNTERENRQSKIIDLIKRLASEIDVNKFVTCDLNRRFNESDIETLVNFLKRSASNAIDGNEYYYPSRTDCRAKIVFYKPNKIELKNLTVVSSGYFDFQNVTGESKEQIAISLLNAFKKFQDNVDRNNINLIAFNIGKSDHGRIDIGEALYGEEVILAQSNGKYSLSRKPNGLFNDPEFSNKVFGVISLERKEHSPVSLYDKKLFVANRNRDLIEKVNNILGIDEIICFDSYIED